MDLQIKIVIFSCAISSKRKRQRKQWTAIKKVIDILFAAPRWNLECTSCLDSLHRTSPMQSDSETAVRLACGECRIEQQYEIELRSTLGAAEALGYGV